MPGDLVSDNDETQVSEPGMVPQFASQHGESLDQSGNVLLRIGAPNVQKKRIVDVVSIQHALGLRRVSGLLLAGIQRRGRAGPAEDRIGSVVYNPNAAGWNSQDGFDVAPSSARNSHDAIGAEQSPAQIK